LYSDQTWTGAPKIGSSNYSLSYVRPLGTKTQALMSLGFGVVKPVEFQGIAKNIRTNQFQAVGLINHRLIDLYDRDLSMSGQFSFLRSNLYLNDRELPSVIPDLIRKPQSGYIRLSLEANKISRAAVTNAQFNLTQAVSGSTPDAQLGTLSEVGITPDNSRTVGAVLSNTFLIRKGMQLRVSFAAQKALGPLVNSMRFQIGADSGLIGVPSTVLSGENGFQATSELLVPLGTVRSWTLSLKPFYGYGAVSSQSGISNSMTTYGTLLSLSNPSKRLTIDVGWTGNSSTQPLIQEAWQQWSLGQGLFTRAAITF